MNRSPFSTTQSTTLNKKIKIDKILLFHITPLDNFPSILQCGGIYCKNNLKIHHSSIAYEGIQDRRSNITVPLYPNGNLHDYVPFYFAHRSPMLSAIHHKKVPNCHYYQQEIFYMVTTVKRIVDSNMKFVFTDGHAIMEPLNFYGELDDLHNIDWKIMKEKYWANTPEDSDRKRRRQAEFLVHQFFPITAVAGLVVYDENKKQQLNDICIEKGYEIKLAVKRDWYY